MDVDASYGDDSAYWRVFTLLAVSPPMEALLVMCHHLRVVCTALFFAYVSELVGSVMSYHVYRTPFSFPIDSLFSVWKSYQVALCVGGFSFTVWRVACFWVL